MAGRGEWLRKRGAGSVASPAVCSQVLFRLLKPQMWRLQHLRHHPSPPPWMRTPGGVTKHQWSVRTPGRGEYSSRYLFFEQPDRLSPEIWPKLELGVGSTGFGPNHTNWNNANSQGRESQDPVRNGYSPSAWSLWALRLWVLHTLTTQNCECRFCCGLKIYK